VWTVKDINSIKMSGEKEGLGKYFFWEENTKTAWLDRIGDKATLTVTYTNDTTKTMNIQDLAKKARIYRNSNPNEGGLVDWWEEDVYYGRLDFDIMTIRYPITKKSADLGIILYYRGAQLQIPVSVYATLVKIEAPQSTDFWPDPYADNDVDNGTGGAAALADKLDAEGGVKAWYQAINDSSDQEPVTLKYWPSYRKAGGDRPYGTGPYYIFASTADRNDNSADGNEASSEDYDTESTYAKGVQKYINNSQKGKATTTNITIRHLMNVWIDLNAENPYTSDDSVYYSGITNYYSDYFRDKAVEDGYDERDWPGYPLLPNGYNVYDETRTKAPWGYVWAGDYDGHSRGEVFEGNPKDYLPYGLIVTDPRKNFGPKVSQTKKTKVSVNWVSHY